MLLVAAVVVAFGPWRWKAAIGLGASHFVLVGGTIAAIVN
jgi:hypothetical protein